MLIPDDIKLAAEAALLQDVQKIADDEHDGHLTILKFTTCWKACFGTPDLDTGEGRAQIDKLPRFPTLGAALVSLVDGPRRAIG